WWSPVSCWCWGLRVGDVAVGVWRIRRAAAGSSGSLLVDVIVSRSTNHFQFVLLKYARHQPRHLHRRLRTQINGRVYSAFLAVQLDQAVAPRVCASAAHASTRGIARGPDAEI